MTEKDKVFWRTFLTALGIFIALVLIFSIYEDETHRASLQVAYNVISFFAVIYLCARIGLDFAKDVDVEDFIKEKGITRLEFNERYGDLMEKIRHK
ncbi:MAG: hypothetical protein NUV54_00870 [Candidatus Taylorbacteria bacterium]|nr:hypothetical protein [Candidatus Taylorbacteria bacterium]